MIVVDNRGSFEGLYPRLGVKELSTILSSSKLIAVDTETTGLDPFLNRVIMLQIGTKEHQFIIDCRNEETKLDIVKWIKPILENPDVSKVLVNAKFDLQMIHNSLGITMVNVIDCMLNEQYIVGAGFRDGRYSFKALSKKYLGYEAKKEIAKEFLTVGARPFTDEQVSYGAVDVLAPILIYEQQLPLIRRNSQEIGIQLESKFVEVLAKIELQGMYLDQDKWITVYDKAKRRLNWYDYLLKEMIIDMGLYDEYGKINWNSSKQVVKLFTTLKIPTKIINQAKTIDKDNPIYKNSVAKDHISQYRAKYPIIRLYLLYKEYHKLTTTYGIKFFKHIHPTTGRVHSNYTQVVATGRLSSANPNLQNISSGSNYRSCFTPSDSSRTFVVADYSAQESRVMADLSGDKVLEDFFLNGDGDFHSFTARKMFKIPDSLPVPKHQRRVSKTLNFGIPYGMGASKLAKQFFITIREADRFISQWLGALPGLNKHFNYRKYKTLIDGYVTVNPITNLKAFHVENDKFLLCKYALDAGSENPEVKSNYFRIKSSLERMAQNYEIQGTAAAITKLACIYIDMEFTERKLDAAIINIVHDEIITECDKQIANTVNDIMKECMERAGAFFCRTIPITATPCITDHWTH